MNFNKLQSVGIKIKTMFILFFITLNITTANAARILILGDSLSVPDGYGFGRELEKQLKAQGHAVCTTASCGASPSSFVSTIYKTQCGFYQSSLSGPPISISYSNFKIDKTPPHLTPKLDKIFDNDVKPELTVIQQGTNMYGFIFENSAKTAASLISNQVKKMLEKLQTYSPQSKCLWIGPPQIAKYDAKVVSESQKQMMADAIREGIQSSGVKCEFLDSREVTPMPVGDGTHFSSILQTSKWIAAAQKEALLLLVPLASEVETNRDQSINCKSKIEIFDKSKVKKIEKVLEKFNH